MQQEWRELELAETTRSDTGRYARTSGIGLQA
jgi:hypothetical protein